MIRPDRDLPPRFAEAWGCAGWSMAILVGCLLWALILFAAKRWG